MAKISPELLQKLKSQPQETASLVVRVTGDPEAVAQQAHAWGITVRHVYRLSPGIAVEGSANACLRLLDLPSVVSIEPDQTVHVLKKHTT
ncbi:MAG: hypothetical protein EXR62_05940 [Chloroflexi bacterium]|nr:hypothetical protein [Chloroflexota bacterium]